MKKEKKKRNPQLRLLDNIGRICPELKGKIAQIQSPPSGPYEPGQLGAWLLGATAIILQIVLHLGRRLFQEVLDAHVRGIDRGSDSTDRHVCPCGKCGSAVWHYNGSRPRSKTFLSIFGKVTLWRCQAECSRCEATFYPLDVILGISSSLKLLPFLQNLVVFTGTHLPYREAAQVLQMTLGIHLSAETIRKAVNLIGKAIATRQKNCDWEPEVCKLGQAMKEADGPVTLEVTVDGAMVPLNHKPKAEEQSHKEARSVSLRLKDSHGKLLCKLMISRLTDLPAFLVSISSLLDECRQTLLIRKILLAADGARWIWEFAKKNLIVLLILDWHHLRGYYTALVEAARGGGSATRCLRLERIEEALWNGRADEALGELKGFRCQNDVERQAKNALVRYVQNNREKIINYNWNWQRRKIVGSGAIEGGQRKAIHDRMKCSGMRWSESGADHMMAARCSTLNETLDHDVSAANLAA